MATRQVLPRGDDVDAALGVLFGGVPPLRLDEAVFEAALQAGGADGYSGRTLMMRDARTSGHLIVGARRLSCIAPLRARAV